MNLQLDFFLCHQIYINVKHKVKYIHQCPTKYPADQVGENELFHDVGPDHIEIQSIDLPCLRCLTRL